MSYTIQEVSKMTNIPTTTLRYYDKEGLLPFLKRESSGYRTFSDIDISMLQIIQCLKSTGMAISDIKQFTQWLLEGDSTLKKRQEMFLKRKEAVENEIKELNKMLDIINFKCEYYKKAIQAGTDKHLFGKDKLPHADEFLKHK
ncbi:MAG: MerR family transcriptional regulator [Candidatus Riflebacteria bacterium]|jgi:DNA-binding transcriptional MerR regulator|nr:MerR family transcriptional regulator [Candidatus Riflebacteria bacterium]